MVVSNLSSKLSAKKPQQNNRDKDFDSLSHFLFCGLYLLLCIINTD